MNSASRKLVAFVAVILAAVGGAAWLVHSSTRPAETPAPDPSPPLKDQSPTIPAISRSPYLNTSPDAKYVGTQVCAECHRDAHRTYSETGHSRALFPTDPKSEPPDGRFHHALSNRTYTVHRRDGRMWHRETAGDPQQNGVELVDLPVKYTIGSGRFSRSYLIETDGFLVESPITWYAAKKAWLPSPGYDRPVHGGFTRETGVGCLYCHSGRVEAIDNSLHRIRVHEFAVSCENCHGPGSLHVASRRAKKQMGKVGIDYTIVQPGRLSRELKEAICAQCHLRGQATTFLRGRDFDDFRPGLPLTDFRIDYMLETPADSMKVVGHLEQMRRSRCYTQTKTLTCTTCHNPHYSPDEKAKVLHYRQVCLTCHEQNGTPCKVPHKTRIAKDARENCVACHMPQVPTDLPHFAFTHHRIGTGHTRKYDEQRGDGRRLVPVTDESHLPQADRDRNLGLAYLELSGLSDPHAAAGYLRPGYTLLQRAYAAGVRDAEVLAGMARMHWERGSNECLPFARAALEKKHIAAGTRIVALVIKGEHNLRLRQFNKAEAALLQLVTCRRRASDWEMLGLCRMGRNDTSGAITAFRKAVEIRPDDPGLHERLADALMTAGKTAQARAQRDFAQRLDRLNPKPIAASAQPK